MPDIDVAALTDADLESLRLDVVNEVERRYRLANTPSQVEQMAERYLTDSGRAPGQPWVQPTGAHDAYPQGWTVTYNGAEWESLTPANVWAPGVSGWRELVPDGGGPAAWVQPAGAHDAYQIGDLVTYQGQTWVSVAANNVWAPGVYGWNVA